MGQYRMEEEEAFPVAPADAYFIDLVWIEDKEGQNGPYLRWNWTIADIPAQKEYAGCFASSMTSASPTTNNKFGEFLRVLLGDCPIGDEISTEKLCLDKYRVKAFVKHNKVEGYKNPFLTVETIIEGTSQKGTGAGPQASGKKLRPLVNVYLKSVGLQQLEEKKKDYQKKESTPVATQKPVVNAPIATKTTTEAVPW